MEKEHLNSEKPERAVLVGLQSFQTPMWKVNDNLDELEQLAFTAGAEPDYRIVQSRARPDKATFIGKGKVNELLDMISGFDIDLVIFDDDLTPAQVRNLEIKLNCKILDRSGLILSIFAKRARTKESRIQVELAQLQYMLPRLTRQWSHLSRQVGGIGTRGPGETQLETDRRVINQRINSLKRELKKIERSRDTRRKRRQRVFKVALTGYTNAGKSTIFNALTKSDVFVEDLLFATLDPTVRTMYLPSTGQKVLLIDTVGFIRKLPDGLVKSFKSTVEETLTANLLVNVVDISHPQWEDQLARTDQIINELKLNSTPQLIVFNKVDKVDDPVLLEGLKNQFPEALFISALRGIRIWEMLERIAGFAAKRWIRGTRVFSPDEGEELRVFEKNVKVQGRSFREGMIFVDYLIEIDETDAVPDAEGVADVADVEEFEDVE